MACYSLMVAVLLALRSTIVVVFASNLDGSTAGECDPSSLLQTTLTVDRSEAAPFQAADYIGHSGEPATLQSLDAEAKHVLLAMLREAKELQEPDSPNTSNKSSNTSDAAESAAEATGVSANSDDDWKAFIAGTVLNLVIIVVSLLFFLVARAYFPEVYSGNILDHTAPVINVPKGLFDWVSLSFRATTDEIQDAVGLDAAMFVEYMHMCMNILAFVSIPVLCIMAPLNYLFGGNAAGKDYLSYLSVGNVQDGSWVYWVDAFCVWIVVFIVQVNLYRAMNHFIEHRIRWMRELPQIRANTILVEEIPEDFRSDFKLKEFFEKIFGRGTVQWAQVIRNCPGLAALITERDAAKKAWRKAQLELAKGKDVTTKQVKILKELYEVAEIKVKSRRDDILAITRAPGGMHCAAGFVHFYKRINAELATGAQYSTDIDEWNVSLPPPAEHIFWDSFKVTHETRVIKKLVGYGLVAGIYAVYLPVVIGISQLAMAVNVGVFQPVWASLAPTLGLQIMVMFLPTLLILIFYYLFSLPDMGIAQEMLQNWYFVFQVVFVLLVTAIGSNATQFLVTLVTSPFEIFALLGEALPTATHFYMNFQVLQWAANFSELMRTANLGKYIVFKHLLGYENPKELSEPEDQDYYGIGSRSARFTINMCVGIVYGTMSPPITFLTFVNFCLSRMVYGYLIPFAETKKEDLGGVFFVHQLNHTFVGNGIYVIGMSGVLLGRCDSVVPGLICAGSLAYVLWSYQRFTHAFDWDRFPVPSITGKESNFEEHQPPTASLQDVYQSGISGLQTLYHQTLDSGHPATLRQMKLPKGGEYVQPEFYDKPDHQ